MMDPGTLSLIGTIAMVAGTVTGVTGTIISAVGQSQAADYNAKVARQNAIYAEQAGQQQRQIAAENERRQRLRTEKLLGAQRAGYGKAGVTMEGSPLEVMGETATQGELDALNIRYGGEVGAYNANVQASRYRSQASFYDFESGRTMATGMIGAGTTLLTGVAKAAGYWGTGSNIGTGYSPNYSFDSSYWRNY